MDKEDKLLDENNKIIDVSDEKDNSKENLNDNNVTREINLDELYDGAVNNTVVIDPISNEEVLQLNKKSNSTLFIVILIAVVLLVLYYVNNNFDINFKDKKTSKKSTSKVFTTTSTTNKIVENGTLLCEFNVKSDSENQNITYTANYTDSLIKTSEFNYVLMSNMENVSDEASKLLSEYEDYFINNSSIIGNNVTFEKTDIGFNFNDKVDYDTIDFNSIIIEDNKMNYFVKPTLNDTYTIVKDSYEKKGFSCKLTNISSDNNEEETK